MKVIIEQRHTLNTHYIDCQDCALSRAIKEQYPSFNLEGVGGRYIRNEKREYEFNAEYETGWNNKIGLTKKKW